MLHHNSYFIQPNDGFISTQVVVTEFVDDLIRHVSFYLNIDDINFDTTDLGTDSNANELPSIDTSPTSYPTLCETETNDVNRTELKSRSKWSTFKRRIGLLFKIFKFKH